MKEDIYSNFRELALAETEGVDFEIISKLANDTHVIIIAPHGGKIEGGTTEIASAIAEGAWSFYSFLGKKNNGNRSLHITSHNFDEPRCIELVSTHENVMAIHGCGEDGVEILIGGSDDVLKKKISNRLLSEGFQVKSEGHAFMATHPNNICNKGQKKAGLQFELTIEFRKNDKLVSHFINVVRSFLTTDLK